MSNDTITLSIDPGTNKIGVALWRNCDLMRVAVIKSPAMTDKPSQTRALYRTMSLARNLVSWLGDYSPQVQSIAIERQYQNQQLLRAEGVFFATVALWLPNCEFHHIAPMTAKKLVVGKGNADKGAVRDALEAVYGDIFPEDDDASDAVAIGYAALGLGPLADLRFPLAHLKELK